MHNAFDAERPHGGATQRRQEQSTHRVAQRVTETALERLQPEFGQIRGVLALRRFDELRTDEPTEIDRIRHGVLEIL
jgi:hypothetical protein